MASGADCPDACGASLMSGTIGQGGNLLATGVSDCATFEGVGVTKGPFIEFLNRLMRQKSN
jgi:hypothetical protein